MSDSELLVADVTEAQLLARILPRLGPSRALVGPGDDAAVVRVAGGDVVVTTDTLVHGPDFRLAWSTGFDVGYKSAAVNLADIAAMGARPVALVVALALPPTLPVRFVDELADGFRAGCDELAPGCAVEGGDLTSSDTLTIAVTALGELAGRKPVLRSGARAGDVLAIAGDLGRAGRGLALLFGRFRDSSGAPIGIDPAALTEDESVDLATQLRPHPPIALGIVAAEAGATAMMDVSDGLVLDATRMADASGVTIAIDGGLDAASLSGGEDHALLAAFPPDIPLPPPFRQLGTVQTRGADAVLVAGAAYRGTRGWDPYQQWDGVTG